MIKRLIKKFIIKTVVEDIQANGPLRLALACNPGNPNIENIIVDAIYKDYQANGPLRHLGESSLPYKKQL